MWGNRPKWTLLSEQPHPVLRAPVRQNEHIVPHRHFRRFSQANALPSPPRGPHMRAYPDGPGHIGR